MKYSGESRHIGLKTQLAKSRCGAEEIRIRVQDHWLGINPDELPEILEPFRRGREVIEVYEEAHLVD